MPTLFIGDKLLSGTVVEIIPYDHHDLYYTEAEIDTKLNSKAGKSSVVTATLATSSWTGTEAPYSYALTISRVTTSSNQEILPAVDITVEQLEALQAANKITLKAYGEKPTINLPIRIIKRGD